ncbi:MAG: DUF1731 domain-containing protein [Aeromicrobium sp.]
MGVGALWRSVAHLAGELVDQRPTKQAIARLTSSRVEPTTALVEAARAHAPVRWLQMSTAAIYGNAGEDVIVEGHPVADGPAQMTGVAIPWEEAATPAAGLSSLVILRTGVVLQKDSPVLGRLTSVTRWGLGGAIAGGRQWTTWMHIDDFLAAVDALSDDDGIARGLEGPVHVCSPAPVRNSELMAALRRACHRPSWAPPTPRFAVRIGAPILGTDAVLALTGRRCRPKRLTDEGFGFHFDDIDQALADLLAGKY